MNQRFAYEALVLVDQLTGRDWHDVAGEREQPAGKGVGAADPEAAVLRVTVHRLAQSEGGGRGTGVDPKVHHGVYRVAGAELPGLTRAGVVAEVEGRSDGVVRVPGRVAFRLSSVMRFTR